MNAIEALNHAQTVLDMETIAQFWRYIGRARRRWALLGQVYPGSKASLDKAGADVEAWLKAVTDKYMAAVSKFNASVKPGNNYSDDMKTAGIAEMFSNIYADIPEFEGDAGIAAQCLYADHATMLAYVAKFAEALCLLTHLDVNAPGPVTILTELITTAPTALLAGIGRTGDSAAGDAALKQALSLADAEIEKHPSMAAAIFSHVLAADMLAVLGSAEAHAKIRKAIRDKTGTRELTLELLPEPVQAGLGYAEARAGDGKANGDCHCPRCCGIRDRAKAGDDAMPAEVAETLKAMGVDPSQLKFGDGDIACASSGPVTVVRIKL